MGLAQRQLNQPRWLGLFSGVVGGYLAVLFLLPLIVVVWTLAAASGTSPAVALPTALSVVAMSAAQAALSSLTTLAVGLPITHLVSRTEFRGRRLFQALVLLPFILPTVVTGLALRTLTQAWLAPGIGLLLLGHVYVNVAVVVKLVGPAWARIDERLETIAKSLGASNWQAFLTVTLPLLKPVVVRAAAVVFAYCFSSLGLALVLGGGFRTPETLLVRQVSVLLDFRAAALTAVLQLVVVTGVLFFAGRGNLDEQGVRENTRHRRRIATLQRLALLSAAAAFSLPLLRLLWQSISVSGRPTSQWWRAVLSGVALPGGEVASAALGQSLRIGIATALVAIAVGLLAAGAKVRGSRWPGVLASLPLAVSSATLGLGLLLTFGRPPLTLVDRQWLLPLTHSLLALPMVVALTSPLVASVDRRLSLIASSLGASPTRAFLTAYGPRMAAVGAVAGAVAFAVSVGEYGAASFLADAGSPTAAVLVLRLLSKPGAQSVGVAAVLAVLLALVAAAVSLMLEKVGESR